MNLLFESPSWVLSALLVVVPSIVISLGLLWMVRRNISIENLRKNHDVVGFTFSIVGVLYSVILGFTVISAQERYNKAEETAHSEATALADLFRNAEFFDNKNRIREDLQKYVEYVVKDEWNFKGKVWHLEAQTVFNQIWDDYYNVNLNTEKVRIWYEQSIEKLDDLMNARLTRTFNSWQHLGSMMWSLLIIGALITICFMFFFGLENFQTQMLMTALLSGYLSFMLYLVFSLDHIFEGPEGIQPTAFEQVFELFDKWSTR
jgi:hypothetical protein